MFLASYVGYQQAFNSVDNAFSPVAVDNYVGKYEFFVGNWRFSVVTHGDVDKLLSCSRVVNKLFRRLMN